MPVSPRRSSKEPKPRKLPSTSVSMHPRSSSWPSMEGGLRLCVFTVPCKRKILRSRQHLRRGRPTYIHHSQFSNDSTVHSVEPSHVPEQIPPLAWPPTSSIELLCKRSRRDETWTRNISRSRQFSKSCWTKMPYPDFAPLTMIPIKHPLTQLPIKIRLWCLFLFVCGIVLKPVFLCRKPPNGCLSQ